MEKKFQVIFLVVLLVVNILALIYLFSGDMTGFSVVGRQEPLPSDFIKEEDIYANDKGVIIKIENPILSRYENTGSMAPLLGEKSTGVGFKPNSQNDINIGDIISFNRDGMTVIHRVIKKSFDSEGVFFITQGDNNSDDDGKVRFSEIESVLVAIIY